MYRSPDNQRTWLVKWFVTPNEQQGIQLKHYTSSGQLNLELYAKKSVYSPSGGWKFFDADVVQYKKVPLIEDFSSKSEGVERTVIMPITEHFAELDDSDKLFKEFGEADKKNNEPEGSSKHKAMQTLLRYSNKNDSFVRLPIEIKVVENFSKNKRIKKEYVHCKGSDRYHTFASLVLRIMACKDENLKNKVLNEANKPQLQEVATALENLDEINKETLEAMFNDLAEKTGLKMGKLAGPTRAALSRKKISPSVFDMIPILGKDKSLERLKKFT